MNAVDPTAPVPHALERVAMAALHASRILMEAGAGARATHEAGEAVVRGLGADYHGMRVGYASAALTVGHGEKTLTRMVAVGRHAVNRRLEEAVLKLIRQTQTGPMTVEGFESSLDLLVSSTPRHPFWFVAMAVGLACASFGMLLGMDIHGFLAVWIGGAFGQTLRHTLLKRHMNVFVTAFLVAFAAGLIAGEGARWLGSATSDIAMMAAILLLVPGVPAANAEIDILDGYPTLGSARAVSVTMIMMFAATGIGLSGVAMRLLS